MAVVQAALDAYVRRDVEAMRRVASADVELDWSASDGWLAGVYHGFEETMRFYADYFEAFQVIEIDAEYIPAGNSVVVPNTARQRGRDGIAVSARATFVFDVSERRITRIRLYQETDEARKAVGLAD